MFARSTTWRQGEGRTWQNATSIRKTFPSRASRLEGLTSRWAIPAFHSLRTMDSASRIMSRLTSASRISVPRGPERLHPAHADAQLIGKGPADVLAPRPVDGQMGALSAPVGDGKRAPGREQPEQHQGDRHPDDRAGHDPGQVAAAGQ